MTRTSLETMVHKFPLSCVFFPQEWNVYMKPDEIVYVVCFPGLHSSSLIIPHHPSPSSIIMLVNQITSENRIYITLDGYFGISTLDFFLKYTPWQNESYESQLSFVILCPNVRGRHLVLGMHGFRAGHGWLSVWSQSLRRISPGRGRLGGRWPWSHGDLMTTDSCSCDLAMDKYL